MKGSQIRRQQEGQENAAVANDGSHKGDNAAYKKYSQRRQYQAGGGKKAGIIKAGIGLAPADAIGDENNEGYPDDESYGNQFEGECQVDLLAACARKGLEEAIEQGIREDIA